MTNLPEETQIVRSVGDSPEQYPSYDDVNDYFDDGLDYVTIGEGDIPFCSESIAVFPDSR